MAVTTVDLGMVRGADGKDGAPGAKGADGATWLFGTAAPTNQGKAGDFYINTSNFDVYNKVTGTWVKTGNIKGETGPQGVPGTNGKDGTNGTNGKDGAPGAKGADGATWLFGTAAPAASLGKNTDFYLNTATFDVYNKASNAWTKTGNIKGAKGEPTTLVGLGVTATAAELNCTKGVTSAIQTQLNGKAAEKHTHEYLPLRGGTLTGEIKFSGKDGVIRADAKHCVGLESDTGSTLFWLGDGFTMMCSDDWEFTMEPSHLKLAHAPTGAGLIINPADGVIQLTGKAEIESQNGTFSLYTNHLTGATCSLKKKAGIVQLNCKGKVSQGYALDPLLIFGTLPAGFRPATGSAPLGTVYYVRSDKSESFMFTATIDSSYRVVLDTTCITPLLSGLDNITLHMQFFAD